MKQATRNSDRERKRKEDMQFFLILSVIFLAYAAVSLIEKFI